jgi:hypothetical protein
MGIIKEKKDLCNPKWLFNFEEGSVEFFDFGTEASIRELVSR